jgi:photoactive yellow protein
VSTHTIHEHEPAGGGSLLTGELPASAAVPFGLFELDAAGKVVRYSPASEQSPTVTAKDVYGRDFFTEVVPARQVRDLQARFHVFMAHGQSTDRFSATFDANGNTIKVQVVLAAMHERSEGARRRLALVRVMPDP